MARAVGKPLLPWQQYVADVGLEVDANGRFVYRLVLVTVPRQSGKTTLFGGVMAQRAFTVPFARVWFTMQTQKDAVDWLTNEYWPLLSPFGDALQLRRMAGSEHVKARTTGGLIRPFPPNATGLHGKTSDLVVVDEAWSFDVLRGQQLDQAIVPTQATKPNAQVWKVSTAGDAAAIWWLGTVETGRTYALAGRTDGVAFFDWSCPDDMDPTDPASWPQYHPAYGRTIGPENMDAALAMLGPDEFARAYGNRWVSMTSRVIPLDVWRVVNADDVPLPAPGDVALGFDVALDRSDAAVCAAWRDETGLAHVEVADHRDGVGWLPDRVGELVDAWRPRSFGYDAAGPALDVADVLSRRGFDLSGLTGKEYAAACAGLLSAMCEDPPTVRFRSHAALDAAASSAARRSVGDGWAWGRRQSATSIAALTAATVALWAYDHAPAAIGDFRIY